MLNLEASEFNPRAGVFKILTDEGKVAYVPTGVFGGEHKPMWQYQKNEHDFIYPLLAVAGVFAVCLGGWIVKVIRMRGKLSIPASCAIVKMDATLLLSLAAAFYVAAAHIMFAVPGFNGVTIAMLGFFAFVGDFYTAQAKFTNPLQVNFATVMMLVSIYLFVTFYCDMFAMKTDKGVFDSMYGLSGIATGLFFALGFFFRFSFAAAKDESEILISVNNLDRAIIGSIAVFFGAEALGVSAERTFFYQFSFIFLYLATSLAVVRIWVTKSDKIGLKVINTIWIVFIAVALAMTIWHLEQTPAAWSKTDHEHDEAGKFNYRDTLRKIVVLFCWGLVILVPLSSIYRLPGPLYRQFGLDTPKA